MRSVFVGIVAVGMGCTGGEEVTTGWMPGPAETLPGPTDADNDGVFTPQDCDDADPTIYPGADDAPYDGVDSDCAGDSDFDADRDGYDSDIYGGTDCDDTRDQVFPGGLEVCDGYDGDCDGTVDSPVPNDAPTYYADVDEDGYGDALDSVVACAAPEGYIDDATDCDDADGTTYPGAPPVVCDGLDNDCNPLTVEPPQPVTIGQAIYDTLQDAVASAVDGDVIEVCEGVHPVSAFAINAGIEIRGIGMPGVTRIEPVGVETVISVNTLEPVALTQVTVTGGAGTEVGDQLQGGGLRIADGADVTLTDTWIEGNEAEYGAGIYGGDNVTLTLSNAVVRDNLAQLGTFGVGGGMLLGEGAVVTLADSVITENVADFSCGGIDVGVGSTIDGGSTTDVTLNAANLNGGGMCANFGATVTGVRFAGNSAISAGGLYGTDLTLTDVVIEANFGSVSTGGVLVIGDNRFERVTIDGNIGDIDVGGLEVAGTESSAELIDCIVTNNTVNSALGDAGGVELFGARLVSTNTEWGEAGTDNFPNDLWLAQSEGAYFAAGVATFVCDDDLGICE